MAKKELQTGAPPLVADKVEENIALVREHRLLIISILQRYKLVTSDERRQYLTEEDYDFALIITPVSSFVCGQSQEKKFDGPPFLIYVFIFHRECADGKTRMLAKTLVSAKSGNISTCPASIDGESLNVFNLRINLGQGRTLRLIRSHAIHEYCYTGVGDYREKYAVSNYLISTVKQKVEVLRKLKEDLRID